MGGTPQATPEMTSHSGLHYCNVSTPTRCHQHHGVPPSDSDRARSTVTHIMDLRTDVLMTSDPASRELLVQYHGHNHLIMSFQMMMVIQMLLMRTGSLSTNHEEINDFVWVVQVLEQSRITSRITWPLILLNMKGHQLPQRGNR